MKAMSLFILSIVTLASVFSCSYAKSAPYDIQVKELYSEPDWATAKVAFQIPIDVKLLDISDDANWYEISTKFNLGPVEFKYSGWAYIPIGKILAERAEKVKLAAN